MTTPSKRMDTISSYVEEGLESISVQHLYLHHPRTSSPLTTISEENEESSRVWIHDSQTKACYQCGSEFHFLLRRHHCRHCGKIFCYVCSDYFIDIPVSNSNPRFRPSLSSLFSYPDVRNVLRKGVSSNTAQRVCRKCHLKLSELQKLNELIAFFGLLPLDIFDYMKIIYVCKAWSKVAKYYLHTFRNIQYRLSGVQFTPQQVQLLTLNQYYFIGHTTWLLQWIDTIPWNECHNPSNLKTCIYAMDILRCKYRNASCSHVSCDIGCSSEWKPRHAIHILLRRYTYPPLVAFALECIQRESFSEECIYVLPSVIRSLYTYVSHETIYGLIRTFLSDIVARSLTECMTVFWELTVHIQSLFHQPERLVVYTMLKQIRYSVVSNMPKSYYETIQKGYDVSMNMVRVLSELDSSSANASSGSQLDALVSYLDTIPFASHYTFSLPVCMERPIYGMDTKNIYHLTSKTKPIMIRCLTGPSSSFRILLKQEDIRRERVMMNMIRWIDRLLKQECGLDLYIQTYTVFPISDRYGFIQIVEPATTLYSVREDFGFSIQNYIFETNPTLSVATFRERFIKSCAAYTVITFVFGIGDRHLDNIMISDEGCLFHIDYGYILGKDPKPVCPDMRITHEMMDAMGGPHSSSYKQFVVYCEQVYQLLRQHTALFYSLWKDEMSDSQDISADAIYQLLTDRLLPGESVEQSNAQLHHYLEVNRNTYSETVIDFFHKQYKTTQTHTEISSSVQHPISSFVMKTLHSVWSTIRK